MVIDHGQIYPTAWAVLHSTDSGAVFDGLPPLAGGGIWIAKTLMKYWNFGQPTIGFGLVWPR